MYILYFLKKIEFLWSYSGHRKIYAVLFYRSLLDIPNLRAYQIQFGEKH